MLRLVNMSTTQLDKYKTKSKQYLRKVLKDKSFVFLFSLDWVSYNTVNELEGSKRYITITSKGF